MREIKFRAWSHDTMWRVMSLELDDKFGIYNTRNDVLLRKEEDESDDFREWTKNLKLMQYTGLKDKNGVDIYEGDIVAMFGNTQRSEVVWDLGAWMIYLVESGTQEGESLDLLFNHTGICEVVGNTYDNPKLLTKGGK